MSRLPTRKVPEVGTTNILRMHWSLILVLLTAVKISPTLDYDIYTADGKRGWNAEWFAHESDESMTPVAEPIRKQFMDETRIFIRYADNRLFILRWPVVPYR